MPNVICTLPKEFIIGEEHRRRKAKYTIHTTEHEIEWEDHERGLIARNVAPEVARLFRKNDGFFIEQDTAPIAEKVKPAVPEAAPKENAPDLSKAASDATPPSKPYPASPEAKPRTAAAKK